MIFAAIVTGEVAFWVLLVAGLAARYVLRRPRLGMLLLLGTPIVDAALLAVTAIDLHRGATPTQAHALAAAYLGFTVAFGHSLVSWADQRFAHRFAGGPAPVKRPKTGPAKLRYEWREFAKAAVAWGLSCVILLGLAAIVGNAERAQTLLGFTGVLSLVLVIWFVTGPVPATLSGANHRGRSA